MMNRRTIQAGSRGFTLMEVLAVVAIVAALMGLVVPTLSGARDVGRSAACLSNLRQMGTCLQAYAADWKDCAAPGAANFAANLQRWHGSRARVSDAFSAEGGALSGYLNGGGAGGAGAVTGLGVRECPTFAPVLAELSSRRLGFERACGGYGYNNAFVGVQRARDGGGSGGSGSGGWRIVTDRAGSPLSRFASPAMTLALGDSGLTHEGGVNGRDGGAAVVEYSFLEPRLWPEMVTAGNAAPELRPDPTMHFRHGARQGLAGMANVCWLDGHATGTVRTGTFSSGVYGDPTLPSMTGWTGEHDDNGLFDYE